MTTFGRIPLHDQTRQHGVIGLTFEHSAEVTGLFFYLFKWQGFVGVEHS